MKTDQGDAAVFQLENLQALRLKFHRLAPAGALRSPAAAIAFIRQRQIVMSTGHASLPVLAEAIAGRPLVGSWMAHPEAGRIYTIIGRVTRSDLVVAPLVLGMETICAASLGPAVERVARDPNRRQAARRKLPPLARRLLETIEAEGELRMDRWSAPTRTARPARLLLERQLLVRSTSLHTERGYHTSVVIPWTSSAVSRQFAAPARRLSCADAEDQLLIAALNAAVVAPEREVRRWFVFNDGRIDALLTRGRIARVSGGNRIYLTTPALLHSATRPRRSSCGGP